MGARVSIASPERVAIADDHGVYILRDVPAGKYTVFASAIAERRTEFGHGERRRVGDARHCLKEGSLLPPASSSRRRAPGRRSKVASTVNVLTPSMCVRVGRESQDLLREILRRAAAESSLVGGTAQIVSIRA